MKHWQLREAKARLSEVVRLTEDGPQVITVHAKPTAVILAAADFVRLQADRGSFVEFMRRSPLVGVPLQIVRDKAPVRATRR